MFSRSSNLLGRKAKDVPMKRPSLSGERGNKLEVRREAGARDKGPPVVALAPSRSGRRDQARAGMADQNLYRPPRGSGQEHVKHGNRRSETQSMETQHHKNIYLF
jgi:hypothetical protein